MSKDDVVTCDEARFALGGMLSGESNYDTRSRAYHELHRFIDQAEALEKSAAQWEETSNVLAEVTKNEIHYHDLSVENAKLRAALIDLIDGYEESVSYVPNYFREKWRLDDYMVRARKALGGEK